MRILIVEDEIHLAETVAKILKKQNYNVDIYNDGNSGFDNALTGIYDLIILDIVLPGMDGLSILREIRKEGVSTPVILLTSKAEIEDRVAGLDSGADDYLAKPFDEDELLARVRSASRRKGSVSENNVLKYGDIVLNTSTLLISCRDNDIKLTLKECELLELLIARKDSVTTKEHIIVKIWGYDSNAEHNNAEVYISYLRKKLAMLESTVKIITIRGVGYTLQ